MMITKIPSDSHEAVFQISDEPSGLEGYIAVHSTRLGPAAGGLRMREYPDAQDALEDVLRLSRGMTYKNAAAGLPLGGGKAVIIGHPDRDKTPALLHAMGRAVERLKGQYWTAEDMGMSPADMAELARETRYVAGRDSGHHASGDPSPVTAAGVFNAMQVGAAHRFGTADLSGRTVAVQGLGHVGWHLCRMLHETGAKLIVADMDDSRVTEAKGDFNAHTTDPASIHSAEAEIFAPCAIGGTLNRKTIPELRAQLICGAANNQLATSADADTLAARNILYLPDYVANGGGIINVAAEILEIRNREEWVEGKLATLRETMEQILTRALANQTSPAHVADYTVDEMIQRAPA